MSSAYCTYLNLVARGCGPNAASNIRFLARESRYLVRGRVFTSFER